MLPPHPLLAQWNQTIRRFFVDGFLLIVAA